MLISNMQRFARVFFFVCVFLCLTLNYTFPLKHKVAPIIPFGVYYNGHHNLCDNLKIHNYETKPRVTRASNERGTKKSKHSTDEKKENDLAKSIEDLKNADLRQYEQLVIMKKYPYLDIKELEMKYQPSEKTARHSLSMDSGAGIENDPGIYERREDTLNVEIRNRGLSGFAIPVMTVKQDLYKHDPKKVIPIAKDKNNNRVDKLDKYKLENLKQKLLSYLDAKNFF